MDEKLKCASDRSKNSSELTKNLIEGLRAQRSDQGSEGHPLSRPLPILVTPESENYVFVFAPPRYQLGQTFHWFYLTT